MAADLPVPVLDAEGVTVRFGGLEALRDVSLTVEPGRIVSLIGPNGAGKTTFFNVVSGFQVPNSGRLTFKGADLSWLRPVERAKLGMVRTFQRMQLFEDLSVLDNLLVSRELERRPRLGRGLFQGRGSSVGDQVDAEEVAALLGLTAHLGTRVADLSTGIRRLVELGRALMVEVDLLLLDEPSSGLDRSETARFNDVIRTVHAARRGQSILLVEHDMTVALGLADFVYVLEFGRIIARGTPDEIRSDDKVRAAYLGMAPV